MRTSVHTLTRQIRAVSLILLVLPALVIACQQGGTGGQAKIKYGHQLCSKCGNTIDEARFAAQYELPNGQVKVFDDPGCLFRAFSKERVAPSSVHFRDHGSDGWLPADKAWFAWTPQTRSPRGYGWAAYASFGDAQNAVTSAGGGEILHFEQAKERVAPRASPPAS